MKKGQVFVMDFIISIVIFTMIIIFIVAILLTIDITKKETKVESDIMFKKFKQNLATENFSGYTSINASEINFFSTVTFNETKYEKFVNLSIHNESIFKEYFNYNVNEPFLFDVCMFIHNESYGYLNFTGKIAHGVVANNTLKTIDVNCSDLIEQKKNPCHNYELSQVIKTPLMINQEYFSLYFVYCYK